MARWLHVIIPSILLVLGLALRVIDPPVLADMRMKVFDTFQQIEPRDYTPVPVRIVDVDDESLARLGQWPWPRTLVARLVERLNRAGAAAIAFGIVFSEPDRTSPSRFLDRWFPDSKDERLEALFESLPDHDQVLSRAIGAVNAVTGFVLTDASTGPAPALKAGYVTAGDDARLFVPAFRGSVINLPIIEAAAKGNGSVNLVAEHDGVVRRVPLLVKNAGKLYPTLAAEALRVAQGASTYIVKASGASGVRSFGKQTGVTHVKIGALVAPTDAAGRLWLHYTRAVPERTIPAWRIIQEDFDRKDVEGTIIFIGVSAAGIADRQITPLNPAMAGAEIHAQVVEQILLQTFLLRPDWADGAELLYLLVFGVALVLVLPWLGTAWGALFTVTLVAAALGVSWYAFAEFRLLFAPVYPSIVAFLVYISSSVISYLRSEAESGKVRDAFSHYMSPVLVERLAADPKRLKLGGELREITLLFLDIRGFTTIAEQYDAEGLTRLLNRFLTPMSEIILAGEGTIDKYIGDCIMAFWNAPLDDPQHAENACLSALAMRARLQEFNEELKREAELNGRRHMPMRTGAGINTGICCVGNMGSEQRFAYSAMGDGVNLASRLEAQTKTYRVDIIIGETTEAQADGFATIELDQIVVMGKTIPKRIYALLGDRTLRESPDFLSLKRAHDEMMSAYRRQDWALARDRLAGCREFDLAPPDLAALYDFYERRIASHELNPPGPDWNGVFVAETK